MEVSNARCACRPRTVQWTVRAWGRARCWQLTHPTATEARRAFEALAEGGKVTMPLGETFRAETFGMLTDRFGTAWGITHGPRG